MREFHRQFCDFDPEPWEKKGVRVNYQPAPSPALPSLGFSKAEQEKLYIFLMIPTTSEDYKRQGLGDLWSNQ